MPDESSKDGSFRYKLQSPQSIGLVERAKLMVRGYRDARKGLIRISPDGGLTSPFCVSLQTEANYRIEAEWLMATGAMFEIQPELEASLRKVGQEGVVLAEAVKDRDGMRADADIARPGDEDVELNMREFRQARRQALNTRDAEIKIGEGRNRLDAAKNDVSSLVTQLRDFRNAAEAHERIARQDYVSKLAAYVKGAMRVLAIDSTFVNDNALTNEPRWNNDRRFSQYLESEF